MHDAGCLIQRLHVAQRVAKSWASSLPFNIFFALVIVSNSLFLGMQLEWSATSLMGQPRARKWQRRKRRRCSAVQGLKGQRSCSPRNLELHLFAEAGRSKLSGSPFVLRCPFHDRDGNSDNSIRPFSILLWPRLGMELAGRFRCGPGLGGACSRPEHLCPGWGRWRSFQQPAHRAGFQGDKATSGAVQTTELCNLCVFLLVS